MSIIGIVAVDNQWAIGKNNGLLFHLPLDMKHFRELTTHKIVAMGENTLKSFPNGKALKNRVNLVLAPVGHEYDDCITFHDFDNMVKYIKILSSEYDVYIIGGAMFYKSMLPYYDKVIVTKIDAEDKDATAFFPNLDKDLNFKVSGETSIIEDNNYNIKFITYLRRN